LGASTNEARSPSPQVAPVEASVKFSSAIAGRIKPNSLSAIDAAPQPRAAWNWRRLIPVFIGAPLFGGSERARLDSSMIHASLQRPKRPYRSLETTDRRHVLQHQPFRLNGAKGCDLE